MPGTRSPLTQDRIPATLQVVFLASGRGDEVHKPPPEKAASRTYFRNWFFHRKSGSKNGEMSTSTRRLQDGDIKTSLPPAPLKSSLRSSSKSSHAMHLSPQGYLDAMIRARGYSTKRYKALSCAYYNKPTALQQASYHVYLVELIRARDAITLKTVLSSGISPNPCNQFGESAVHMVCRRGDHELLNVFVECGCSLQVTDDYGRTPLHDACWSAKPSFETVKTILRTDARMIHVVDSHSATPLSYVHKEHWPAWINFLDAVKDEIWPQRCLEANGEQPPPPLTLEPANSRPLPNPVHALTPELAEMVASGRMEPEEARFLTIECSDESTVGRQRRYKPREETDLDKMLADYSDEDYDEDDYTDSTFDEDEMADILTNLSSLQAKPIAWSGVHSEAEE